MIARVRETEQRSWIVVVTTTQETLSLSLSLSLSRIYNQKIEYAKRCAKQETSQPVTKTETKPFKVEP